MNQTAVAGWMSEFVLTNLDRMRELRVLAGFLHLASWLMFVTQQLSGIQERLT